MLAAAGIKTQALTVSHAFHSALMEPMLDAFEAVAATVTYHRPTLGVISNVTGRRASDEELMATRGTGGGTCGRRCSLRRGWRRCGAEGATVVVEVGPAPTLTALGQAVCRTRGWCGRRRCGKDGATWASLLEAVATVVVRGRGGATGAALDADWPRRKVALPTYPFQRERFWPDLTKTKAEASVRAQTAASRQPLQSVAWVEQPLPQRIDGPATVLLFADRGGVSASFVQVLRSRGTRVVVAESAAGYQRVSDDRYLVDPTAGDAFDRLFADVARTSAKARVIGAYAWALDAPAGTPESADQALRAAADGCDTLLRLVRAAAGSGIDCRLRVVTRGAQPVTPGSRVSLAQAPLLGLLRTVRNEYPELGCSSIDLDAAGPVRVDAVADELLADIDSAEIALVRGRRLVARLEPSSAPPPQAMPLDGDATYLITGGLGALGLEVARWMAANGAGHLALVGRRPPSTAAAAAIAGIEAAGATVRTFAADVASASDVAVLFAAIDREMPPLRGIVHSAGVLDDGMLAQQTRERFERVLAPKVAGAWNLHQASLDLPLDCFVLFSSIAGVLGTPGQGNYAAANVFLDALAHERRRSGLHALSIDWGPWADVGMAANVAAANVERWAAKGFRLMASAEALALFGRLLGSDASQAVVMPLASDVAGAGEDDETLAPSESIARSANELADALDRARPNRRRAVVHAFVSELARDVFGFDAAIAFDPRQGFRELGMDSLTAVELRNRLQRSVGQVLPATIAFDYPTVDAMARYLADAVLALPPLDEDGAGDDRPAAPVGVSSLLSQAEDLSDEEIERQLAARLAARGA